MSAAFSRLSYHPLMKCDIRNLLDSDVFSAAQHLEQRLQSRETGDLKWELADIKRMAKELVDAINKLHSHENEHECLP